MEASLVAAQAATALGTIGAATGVALAVRAFGNARLLASVPPTPAASLEAGLQEVSGLLRCEDTLVAPLSGRACGFYRLLLEQRRRNEWETVLDSHEAVPAALDDGTGLVRVDLASADVVVAAPERVRSGVFAVPSAELSTLLSRVAPPSIPPAGPFLRWREETLVAGDRLFAVGTAEADADGWALVARPDAPFLVSDRDSAEVIRHQRRAGRRWVAVTLLGLGAATWGALGLLPLLTR
jgi:hypothetical protein